MVRNYAVCVVATAVSIKQERIKKRIYKTRYFARAEIFDYIEIFNNFNRRYTHFSGVGPEAIERASF
jgi:putative transposase